MLPSHRVMAYQNPRVSTSRATPLFLSWSVLLVLSLSCKGGLLGECVDTTKAVIASPDASAEAVLLDRSYGATTPYLTAIELRRPSSRGIEEKPEIIASFRRDPEASIQWTGPGQLSVATSADIEFFRRDERWREVTIRYEQFSRDP